MSENFYTDAEEIAKIYGQSHDATIAELNKMIITLRARVSFLEEKLKEVEDSANKNISAPLKWKIDKLERNNKELKKELKERESTGVSRAVEREIKSLLEEKEKLEKDVQFYKSKVPAQIVINRENKKNPTRKGGLPK